MDDQTRADQELPVVARFEVRRRFYLAPDGSVLRPLPSFASDTGLLISLYRAMVLTRVFDLKAVSLQRTGRLGTYGFAAESPPNAAPMMTTRERWIATLEAMTGLPNRVF